MSQQTNGSVPDIEDNTPTGITALPSGSQRCAQHELKDEERHGH